MRRPGAFAGPQPGTWGLALFRGGSSAEEHLGAIQETGVRSSFAAPWPSPAPRAFPTPLRGSGHKRWFGIATPDELGALPRAVSVFANAVPMDWTSVS